MSPFKYKEPKRGLLSRSAHLKLIEPKRGLLSRSAHLKLMGCACMIAVIVQARSLIFQTGMMNSFMVKMDLGVQTNNDNGNGNINGNNDDNGNTEGDVMNGRGGPPDSGSNMNVKKESSVDIGYITDGVAIFRETADSFQPTTDKVTTHEYYIMYGNHLLPYYYKHPKMKMLEIGLGCDMGYGPGASVKLWKALFPGADLWEAEFDGKCVQKNQDMLRGLGLNTLVGDQGNLEVLDGWIEKSGGEFDVIIDDGGHTNCQIWTSFQKLWPTVKRGGLYFIEDMQVAKLKGFKKSTETCDGKDLNVPNKLKEIFDRLMYDDNKKRRKKFGEKNTGDVEFLFCQPEACVLKKKS